MTASRPKEPEAAKTAVFNAKNAELFGLFMCGMFAAAIAKLREFQTAGGRLFILRRRVVPVLALGALQCNNFAHLSILTDFADFHRPANPSELEPGGESITPPTRLALPFLCYARLKLT